VIALTDPAWLAEHNKVAKAKRTIIYLLKDHLIPHIVEKKLVKDNV
jgi:hypothetical protein